MKILVRIEAPHFVAGCVAVGCLSLPPFLNYKIISAAPILGWTNGRLLQQLVDWCEKKGYTIETYEVGD